MINDILAEIRAKTGSTKSADSAGLAYDASATSAWSRSPATDSESREQLQNTFLDPKPQFSNQWLRYISDDLAVDKTDFVDSL